MKIRAAVAKSGGLVLVLIVSLWGLTAQGQPLIVGHNTAFGGGPITTYDFATGATVGSFVPTGAVVPYIGHGVLVVGNNVYYTGIASGTDFIRIAPFNGGTGGADTGTLPNPRPGHGIQNLAFRNGVLYAMTGFSVFALQVFGLDPVTGTVVSGPVTIASPAEPSSDGFTVLPNGNFLINSGDGNCTFNQFDPSTGALIPGTTIAVPGATICTGVDNDGISLFFQTYTGSGGAGPSFTNTTLSGGLISQTSIAGTVLVEDISLVHNGTPGLSFAGTPGQANCHGKSVSALAAKYGGMPNAALALGFPNVAALQAAITAFCGS